jgi:hypothetical protein
VKIQGCWGLRALLISSRSVLSLWRPHKHIILSLALVVSHDHDSLSQDALKKPSTEGLSF